MTILAATDFSSAAAGAARSAAQLARKLGDSLLLVRAIEPPVSIYPELGLASIEVMDTALREANERELGKARQALAAEAPGADVQTRLVPGVPEQVLAVLAAQENARLIVMGSHGRRPAARFFLGSAVTRTVLEAPCPVLAMREGAAPFEAWVTDQRPLRVLVGIDQGPASEAALAWVKELRKSVTFDLVLVHEYWPPAEYTRLGLHGPRDVFHTDPEVVPVLERELRAMVGDIPGQGEVHLRVRAAWGRLGDALAAEAEATGADLVVVGTHQPHGWERVRTGSKAVGALHTCPVPVVCVPARLRPQAPLPWRVPVPTLRSALCATDFSEMGNAAIPHAYALLRAAGEAGASVELCHVVERHLPLPLYAYDSKSGALTPVQRTDLELRLRALVPAEADRLGIATHVTVIDGGSPADAILQAARRLGVDVIVIASRGRTSGGKTALGSVAGAVVRGADRPVHVVHAPAPQP